MKRLSSLLTCIACMYAACVMGQGTAVHVNIQNDAVSKYMNEVTYTCKEDVSRVADYVVPSAAPLDLPQPAWVDVPEEYHKYIKDGAVSLCYCPDNSFDASITDTVYLKPNETSVAVYDLLPGVIYYYKMYLHMILLKSGEMSAEGPVRMLYTPSVRNVRDMGGWPTADGHTVKYGKLIRGSELNGQHQADVADIEHLKQLGVSAEIDLRASYEEEHGVSAFGFKDVREVDYGEVPSFLYTNDSGQLLSHMTSARYLQSWRQEFHFIVENLRAGRSVFFHCRWGADRTGYLALLLEGLLGVPYDGLVKDYELSSFGGLDKKKEDIDPVIDYIDGLYGETLQEKFYTFWKTRVNVLQEDIDDFIDEMLGTTSGDDVVTSVASVQQAVGSTCYDVWGRRLSARRHGLVIERGDDGSVRKILMR